eukprot:c27843_g1_i1 orf=586-2181(-)
MMDPEMIKLAQEQMSRIPPEELSKMQQQMMNNPELIRMATEGMKNLRPEDVRLAAEQMKNLRPEEIAEMSKRMAHASPEEIAAMRLRSEAQRSYELQAALSLKNEGNRLHGIGKYFEAAEKYQQAKNNAATKFTSEASNLQTACSLNLMSCYLKTNQYEKAVAEGSEVLQCDGNNLKALYRRGQAYKELGKLKLAVADLRKAAGIAPEDETIADTLRQVEEELEQRGEVVEAEELQNNGPIIEEISEEEAERLTKTIASNSGERESRNLSQQYMTGSQKRPVLPSDENFAETVHTLKQNPDMIRNMHTMMSHFNPEQIASMSGNEMTPEMAKFAADMVKQMSPEDLQKMIEMTSTLHRESLASGSQAAVQTSSMETSNLSAFQPTCGLTGTVPGEHVESSRSSCVSNTAPMKMPSLSPEMQEQLHQQMRDPAMKQMMTGMLKNMTPETMASMSEQMGIKLSPEEARRAQKAMSNLSPDDLDRLMRWADKFQRLGEHARRTKNFLLGKPGLMLAVLMLIIAVILHYLGYIGG